MQVLHDPVRSSQVGFSSKHCYLFFLRCYLSLSFRLRHNVHRERAACHPDCSHLHPLTPNVVATLFPRVKKVDWLMMMMMFCERNVQLLPSCCSDSVWILDLPSEGVLHIELVGPEGTVFAEKKQPVSRKFNQFSFGRYFYRKKSLHKTHFI